MKLELGSFERAIKSLEKAIIRSEKEKSDEEIRDAVIHRFEFTYELAWKMLKRQIEKESPTPSLVDTLSFKDLIREGAERGLLKKSETWFGYRGARNKTSHTYEEKSAKEVYLITLDFLPDAKLLFEELKSRNK